MKSFIVKKAEDMLQVLSYLRSVNVEKPLDISIKVYKPNRSAAQNRLYWKWIAIMGDDLGYTKDELHAVLAVKFLGTEEINCMGETITQPISTSTLLVPSFSEYLKHIEIFSHSELGILLPNKDDLYFEAMGIKRKA
jgi:hypothetical protein